MKLRRKVVTLEQSVLLLEMVIHPWSVSYIPLSVRQEKHTQSPELRLKLQWKSLEITLTVETTLLFLNPTSSLL